MYNIHTFKNRFFIFCGLNVIESYDHTLIIVNRLKKIFANYDVEWVFKVSWDKANRTSQDSYRGVGMTAGLDILRRIKEDTGVRIITDIHESWQARSVASVADVIQIPAFLCRQTDLLVAAAETGKIIHLKKGQFCTAEQMHEAKKKIFLAGNRNVILCERGNSWGYGDLVVDPRNLIWLRSPNNLVSMDITHCLQKPGGRTSSGGEHQREMIHWMGKMAIALGVDGLFLEVHDDPTIAPCDRSTQIHIGDLENLLEFIGIPRINIDYLADTLSKF